MTTFNTKVDVRLTLHKNDGSIIRIVHTTNLELVRSAVQDGELQNYPYLFNRYGVEEGDLSALWDCLQDDAYDGDCDCDFQVVTMSTPSMQDEEAIAVFVNVEDSLKWAREKAGELAYNRLDISTAVTIAEQAFWAKVKELYPTAKNGDLSPGTTSRLNYAMTCAVSEWVRYNVPEENNG